ncbi:hypothetical protein [Bradyrhizobium sp. BWA-3-5]|uniref:hypothetical protein n=1 Tax=Bradyrhizobium sp. BWA-3-5 TaxID=3080013 RepID=UPI00293E11A7|nr:hypothetical protein [Bradyrhizobium sp. BWA-3-5]WOH64295.1 hypothetical protein RX331_27540 [Bradyrhizobium sp. BWA-3-5]
MNLDLPTYDEASGPASMAGFAACPFHTDRSRHPYGERKTLVLTEALRVIGYATGKLFSEVSWRIVTCARQPFEGARCPWNSGRNKHVRVDLSDHRALRCAIAEVKERLNGEPLHALIYSAELHSRRLASRKVIGVQPERGMSLVQLP